MSVRFADQPVVQAPEYHEECGHFHFEGEACPELDEPCGVYLCCQS